MEKKLLEKNYTRWSEKSYVFYFILFVRKKLCTSIREKLCLFCFISPLFIILFFFTFLLFYLHTPISSRRVKEKRNNFSDF